MSATFMRIVVPLSLVLLFVVVSEAGILPHLVHIEITNRLNDEKDLTIHCYEREGEDLGEAILLSLEKLSFVFRPRGIGKSSKYYCSVKWSGSNLKWFDLWSQGRDYKNCRVCKWIVTNTQACEFDYDKGIYSICVVYNQ
ncbi:unnamed protein product [Vicia faba]|uniref:S-protein homolog n=1 Tax=Vicia faba TaxID=3906 RepID=A0AAV0YQ83_VICFA|nr:unnamed protein product [Vicia faba]